MRGRPGHVRPPSLRLHAPCSVSDGALDVRVVGLDELAVAHEAHDLDEEDQDVRRHFLFFAELQQRPDVVLALLLRFRVDLALGRPLDRVGSLIQVDLPVLCVRHARGAAGGGDAGRRMGRVSGRVGR